MIEKGDALYKFHNTYQLLSCICLPRVVQAEHFRLNFNFLEGSYGFWNDSYEQNIIDLTRQIL